MLAYVEAASLLSIPRDVGAVRWALRACRIYEGLRGELREPSPEALAFAASYRTTLGAYEMARAFT